MNAGKAQQSAKKPKGKTLGKGEALELMAACMKRSVKELTFRVTGRKKRRGSAAPLFPLRVDAIFRFIAIRVFLE